MLGTCASTNTLLAHKSDELILLSDSQISTEVHYLQLVYKAEHDGGRKADNHGIPGAPKGRDELSTAKVSRASARLYNHKLLSILISGKVIIRAS